MQVIYATGQPRLLEFAIAEQRQAVPAGATVFAICEGDRLVSQLDESLFAAISDEEYYNYMELLREVVKREKRRLRDRNAATTVRRFFNWLSGTPRRRKRRHPSEWQLERVSISTRHAFKFDPLGSSPIHSSIACQQIPSQRFQ